MEQILKVQADHLKKINELTKQDRLLQIAQLYEARKADKDDDRVVEAVEQLQEESHKAFFDDKEGLNSNIVKLGEMLTKQFGQQKFPGLPAKFIRDVVDLRKASAVATPGPADQTLNQTRQISNLIDEKQLQKLFEVQVLNNIQDNLKQLSKEQSADLIKELYAEFKKGITKGIAEELSKATAEQKVAISTLLAREMRQSVGSQAQGEEAPVTKQRKVAGKASKPAQEQEYTAPSTRYFNRPRDIPEKAKNAFTIEGMFDLSEGKSKGLLGDVLRRRVARKQYIQDRMTVDPNMINLKQFGGDKGKLTESLGKQFDKQQEITKEYESNQQRITQLREAGYGEDAIKRSGLLKKQGQLMEDLKEVDPRLRQKKQQPGTPEAPTLATPLQVGMPETAPVVSSEQQNENLRLMTEQNDVLKKIEENTRGLKVILPNKPQQNEQPTQKPPEESSGILDTVGSVLDAASVLGGKGIRGAGSILGRVGRGIGTVATTVGARGAGLLSRGASAVGGLGGVARVLGPAAAVGMGAYDAYTGWQEASAQRARGEITEEQADIAKSAAVGKGVGGAGGALAGAAAGAALGSVVPVVGTAIGGLAGGALGYFGGSKVGEAVGEYGSRAWKGVKGWFGKGDETKTPVATSGASKPETKYQLIAGEPVVPGQPLSARQMAVMSLSIASGNTYSPEVMAQYNKQKQSGATPATPAPATPTPAPATATAPETKPSPVDRKTSGREDIVKQYAAASTAEKQAAQRRKEFEEANKGQASTKQDELGDDVTYYKDPALQKQYEQLKSQEYQAGTEKRAAGAAYAKADNVQKTYAFGGDTPRNRRGGEDIRADLQNDANKIKALEARGYDISKFETTDNSNYIQLGNKRYSRQILGAYEQVIKKELETGSAKLQTPAQPAAAATPAAPSQVTPPPPQTGDAVYRQSGENATAAAVPPPAPPVIVSAPQNTNVSQTTNIGPKVPPRNTESSVQTYNRSRYAY